MNQATRPNNNGWEVWQTGVPGLDHVLGEGIPKLSLTLMAGGPGAGKTILTQQILFHNASPQNPALYFSVMGEPVIKLLRYQRRMDYFDEKKLTNGSLRFISLQDEFERFDLQSLRESIEQRVRDLNPSFVAIDSFRSLARSVSAAGRGIELQAFVDDLGVFLTTWQTTGFLVGEYRELEEAQSPVFSLADNIIWQYQSTERNSVVRKLQVVKSRGQASMPGLHTFKITSAGIEVFPRIPSRRTVAARIGPRSRVTTGLPELDEMMDGGIPKGDAVMVAGASGTGKSVLGQQFLAEGIRQGEAGVAAVFEEHPGEYLARARQLGFDLQPAIDQKRLKLLYMRPLDLSVDEALRDLQRAVAEVKAERMVIDSISGFELALAPAFKEDFRESYYRLMSNLTGLGITVLTTSEVVENFSELQFSSHLISFLADDVVLLRYIEMKGQLGRVLTVGKMRRSGHSKDLRLYEVTDRGIVIGDRLEDYQGIITGVPALRPVVAATADPGLVERESLVLKTLERLDEATVAELGDATGLRRRPVAKAIDRLLELGYIVKRAQNGQRTYQVVDRT